MGYKKIALIAVLLIAPVLLFSSTYCEARSLDEIKKDACPHGKVKMKMILKDGAKFSWQDPKNKVLVFPVYESNFPDSALAEYMDHEAIQYAQYSLGLIPPIARTQQFLNLYNEAIRTVQGKPETTVTTEMVVQAFLAFKDCCIPLDNMTGKTEIPNTFAKLASLMTDPQKCEKPPIEDLRLPPGVSPPITPKPDPKMPFTFRKYFPFLFSEFKPLKPLKPKFVTVSGYVKLVLPPQQQPNSSNPTYSTLSLVSGTINATNVYVYSDDGQSACTDNNGYYQMNVAVGYRTFIYYKTHYEKQKIPIPPATLYISAPTQLPTVTMQQMSQAALNREIYGQGPLARQDIQVILSKLGCVYATENDTIKMCPDGKYTFGDDLTGGIYKVDVSCPNCTFTSQTSYDGIDISPSRQSPPSYDFSGHCP